MVGTTHVKANFIDPDLINYAYVPIIHITCIIHGPIQANERTREMNSSFTCGWNSYCLHFIIGVNFILGEANLKLLILIYSFLILTLIRIYSNSFFYFYRYKNNPQIRKWKDPFGWTNCYHGTIRSWKIYPFKYSDWL